jgi:hypothetical protein
MSGRPVEEGTPDFSWCKKGAVAKFGDKVGQLTMDPDSDREVKLLWLDRSTSSYVKIHRLVRASQAEKKEYLANLAPPRWCKKGAIAMHGGKVGEIVMGPDSDREVRLRWAGGREKSGYIRAALLTQPTAAEQKAAVPWCKKGALVKYNGQYGEVTMDPDSDAEVKIKIRTAVVEGVSPGSAGAVLTASNASVGLAVSMAGTGSRTGPGRLLGWKLDGVRTGDTSGGLSSDGYCRVNFERGGGWNVPMDKVHLAGDGTVASGAVTFQGGRCHSCLQWNAASTLLEKTSESDGDYHSTIGAHGYRSGVHSWSLKAVSLRGNMRLGICAGDIALNRRLDQAGRHAVICSAAYAEMTGKSDDTSLSSFGTGDIMQFVLDMNQGTLTVTKNSSAYHVFTGLGGQEWWPVIGLDYKTEKVELMEGSSSSTCRPTLGDTVFVLNGPGEGTTGKITTDDHSHMPYQVDGRSHWYKESDVQLQPQVAGAGGGIKEVQKVTGYVRAVLTVQATRAEMEAWHISCGLSGPDDSDDSLTRSTSLSRTRSVEEHSRRLAIQGQTEAEVDQSRQLQRDINWTQHQIAEFGKVLQDRTRVVLYVDDEVNLESNRILQTIWRATDACGVHVAKVTSTAEACAFLKAYPALVKRSSSGFRIISDMVRVEATGRNVQAGLELAYILQTQFSYMGPLVIYTGYRPAADMVTSIGLVAVTMDVQRAADFASFKWGHYANELFLHNYICPACMTSHKKACALEGGTLQEKARRRAAAGRCAKHSGELLGSSLCSSKPHSDNVDVTVVTIQRPKADDWCKAAVLFRQVEATFMAFIVPENRDVSKRPLFLVEEVSVFFHAKLEAQFQAAMAKLDAARAFSIGDAQHVGDGFEGFFKHLRSHALTSYADAVPANAQGSAPLLAWHGTTLPYAKNIIANGVDLSKLGALGSWHGKGFYTTTSPRYAEEYLKIKKVLHDSDGMTTLLLNWVLPGKPYPVTNKEQNGKASSPGGFDSNYALTGGGNRKGEDGFHASESFKQHPERATGDELCSFHAERVLPRFFVKFKPHVPVVVLKQAVTASTEALLSASEQQERQNAREGRPARWCVKGAIAKDSGGKVGVVTMEPDSDNEVKLRWTGGDQVSGYLGVGTLSPASDQEQRTAVHQWCRRGVDVQYEQRTGLVLMAPDSDAETKILWNDDQTESDYIKAVLVVPLSDEAIASRRARQKREAIRLQRMEAEHQTRLGALQSEHRRLAAEFRAVQSGARATTLENLLPSSPAAMAMKVVLAPDYVKHSDAADGPLKSLDDIGTVIKYDGSSKPYLVKSSTGKQWWYVQEALRVASGPTQGIVTSHRSATAQTAGSSDAVRALEARCAEALATIAAEQEEMQRAMSSIQTRCGMPPRRVAHRLKRLSPSPSPSAELEPEPEPEPELASAAVPEAVPAAMPKARRCRGMHSAADAVGWAAGTASIAQALSSHRDALACMRMTPQIARSSSFTDARDERMAREIEQMDSAAREFQFALSPAGLANGSSSTPMLDMMAASPSPF